VECTLIRSRRGWTGLSVARGRTWAGGIANHGVKNDAITSSNAAGMVQLVGFDLDRDKSMNVLCSYRLEGSDRRISARIRKDVRSKDAYAWKLEQGTVVPETSDRNLDPIQRFSFTSLTTIACNTHNFAFWLARIYICMCEIFHTNCYQYCISDNRTLLLLHAPTDKWFLPCQTGLALYLTLPPIKNWSQRYRFHIRIQFAYHESTDCDRDVIRICVTAFLERAQAPGRQGYECGHLHRPMTMIPEPLSDNFKASWSFVTPRSPLKFPYLQLQLLSIYITHSTVFFVLVSRVPCCAAPRTLFVNLSRWVLLCSVKTALWCVYRRSHFISHLASSCDCPLQIPWSTFFVWLTRNWLWHILVALIANQRMHELQSSDFCFRRWMVTATTKFRTAQCLR